MGLTEKFESRRSEMGDSPWIEMEYTYTGTSDDLAVKQAVLLALAPTYDGLRLTSVEINPVVVDSVAASGIWDVKARYETVQYPAGEFENEQFDFDTSGSTIHLSYSKQTVGKYQAPLPGGVGPLPPLPDFKQAIGVSSDGIEGVDIVSRHYEWSEQHFIAAATVNAAYRRTVFLLTGTVNNAPFREFAAGEVMFLGAQGKYQPNEGNWAITFRFAASENKTDLSVGLITGISKKGWEYLWIYFREWVDDDAQIASRVPGIAVVERVYDEKDFSALGIGTT